MISKLRPRLRFRLIRTRAGAALAAAALSASCGMPVMAPDALPSERYKIVVRETRAHVSVSVPGDGSGFTPGDEAALRALARGYGGRGHGPVTFALPSDVRGQETGDAALADARHIFDEAGVAPALFEDRAYAPEEGEDAPLLVYYTMYDAIAPDCHRQWRDLSRTFPPNTYNFGCANQANLAAAIVDPYDLLSPRPADPADVARRMTTIERYREGETTATERESDESVTVSESQ